MALKSYTSHELGFPRLIGGTIGDIKVVYNLITLRC